MTQRLRLLLAMCAALGATSAAHAFTQPFYGRAAAAGDLDDPVRFSTGENAGAGTVSTIAGSFQCNGEIGAVRPGCSLAISAGGGTSAGAATVNPFTGTLRAGAGALHYPGAERVHYTVQLPNIPPFDFYPDYWTSATASAYARSTWRITSDTLALGTPVTLQGTLTLDGTLEGGQEQVRYGIAQLINLASEAQAPIGDAGGGWLLDTEFIDYGTVLDLLGSGQAQGRMLEGDGGANDAGTEQSVQQAIVWTRDFAVGDVVVAESFLDVFAGTQNVGGSAPLFDVYARFGRTAQAGLALTTPGAMLAPVPEPATWGLWAVGLLALGSRVAARRRGGATAR